MSHLRAVRSLSLSLGLCVTGGEATSTNNSTGSNLFHVHDTRKCSCADQSEADEGSPLSLDSEDDLLHSSTSTTPDDGGNDEDTKQKEQNLIRQEQQHIIKEGRQERLNNWVLTLQGQQCSGPIQHWSRRQQSLSLSYLVVEAHRYQQQQQQQPHFPESQSSSSSGCSSSFSSSSLASPIVPAVSLFLDKQQHMKSHRHDTTSPSSPIYVQKMVPVAVDGGAAVSSSTPTKSSSSSSQVSICQRSASISQEEHQTIKDEGRQRQTQEEKEDERRHPGDVRTRGSANRREAGRNNIINKSNTKPAPASRPPTIDLGDQDTAGKLLHDIHVLIDHKRGPNVDRYDKVRRQLIDLRMWEVSY